MMADEGTIGPAADSCALTSNYAWRAAESTALQLHALNADDCSSCPAHRDDDACSH